LEKTGANFKKMIIGLTGLYCSGKSTAEKLLKDKYDFLIIDVDKIGHQVLEEQTPQLTSMFSNVILTDNKVDRKKLGKLVFKNNDKLIKLNSLTHPIMMEKVRDFIQHNLSRNICINAALLFDMNLDQFCSTVIIIKTALIKIIKRAFHRDKHSFFRIFNIIFTQKVLKLAKKNPNNVDIFYIMNNKNFVHLENQIKIIISKLLSINGKVD
jgi:dephospho-CoA kinase